MAQLVAAIDRRDAYARVALADVQVDALAERVAQPHHRRLGDPDDLVDTLSGLAPACQPRAGRVGVRPDARQEAQLDEL